jgi:hypothetical protein
MVIREKHMSPFSGNSVVVIIIICYHLYARFYKSIPKTNHVSRVYNIGDILWLHFLVCTYNAFSCSNFYSFILVLFKVLLYYYYYYCYYTAKRKGGGVLGAFHPKFNVCTCRQDLQFFYECVFVELHTHKGPNLLTGTIISYPK